MLKENAYDYLPKYIIDYNILKKEFGIEGLNKILNITDTWFDNSYMLFRHYTVYYFIKELEKNV